jgi:hypothetical protein
MADAHFIWLHIAWAIAYGRIIAPPRYRKTRAGSLTKALVGLSMSTDAGLAAKEWLASA